MITVELSEADLNKLVRTAGGNPSLSALNNLSNFKLQDGCRISFDQSFKLSTTPLVVLSADSSGKLVIEILRLADNSIGNFILQMFEDKITGIIEEKTRGVLHKESGSKLSLDIKKFLPCGKCKRVSGTAYKLTLDIAVE